MILFDAIVIGGGPAGMICAGRLADRKKSVALIEKNPFLGKKLCITGKGRCNITNICDTEEMINNVTKNNRFLYSAFYSFTNYDIIDLLKKYGVETKTERGGRVFPVSDKARDVRDALLKYCTRPEVKIIFSEAEDILHIDNKISGVMLSDGRKIEAKSVVICTGGKSYPLTGSTGDGYAFAEKTGHTVEKIKASLIPLETYDKWVSDAMGLALKNVGVKFFNKSGKLVYEDFGEMLFTHFGVSGPVVLSASAHLRDFENDSYTLVIDLKPALDEKKLDERILRDFSEGTNKHLVNSLGKLLPKKLIDIVIEKSEIAPHTPVNEISRQMRKQLVHTVKNLSLQIKGARPVEEAIVTSGGVSTKQINPSTMESKIVSGLYFAGEVIDVDAYTGGFNLQIAYSTGYLAGSNA